MRYSKPTVIDLNSLAASGARYQPACLAGTAVTGGGCATGDIDAACDAGTGGALFPGDDCVNGETATGSYSCLTGGTADWECAAGTTPTYRIGCTAGPSY